MHSDFFFHKNLQRACVLENNSRMRNENSQFQMRNESLNNNEDQETSQIKHIRISYTQISDAEHVW